MKETERKLIEESKLIEEFSINKLSKEKEKILKEYKSGKFSY